MINISEENILSVYGYTKHRAVNAFNKGLINRSLEFIELSCKIAYNFNLFYKDDELENLLGRIASIIYTKRFEKKSSQGERYVLIDTNGSDNHGLTQQYLRALMKADVEFAYVYEDTDLSRISLILSELAAYPKATVFTFAEKLSLDKQISEIYQFLLKYSPTKYLMHIMPWDVVAVTISVLLEGIDRYNINATDHAFWLGANCIDYCIEFRDYGYSVSIDKRGLSKEQLLLLPYYPIFNKSEFLGFPGQIPKDCVKIFSGGSFYKIYGDNGLYFSMVKQVLLENNNAVLLYAGSGNDKKFRKFIETNELQHKVFIIGNRKDIYEVFSNSDIYLATYPISGGLMSQFAALCAKPILAYTSPALSVNRLEGTVCHEINVSVTRHNLEDFYNYAKYLIGKKENRIYEGSILLNGVISADRFNEELINILAVNKSKRIPKKEYIDYNRFSKLYLEVENNFEPAFQKLVASSLKFRTILFPKIFCNTIIIILRQIFVKLKIIS